jgi:hypothetical protein
MKHCGVGVVGRSFVTNKTKLEFVKRDKWLINPLMGKNNYTTSQVPIQITQKYILAHAGLEPATFALLA